jgi:hypothetical protein
VKHIIFIKLSLRWWVFVCQMPIHTKSSARTRFDGRTLRRGPIGGDIANGDESHSGDASGGDVIGADDRRPLLAGGGGGK